jgi:hypothetical protein
MMVVLMAESMVVTTVEMRVEMVVALLVVRMVA